MILKFMNFNRALIIIGLVLIAHVVAMLFGLYGAWHWFDIPMHFGGGLAAGALGLAIWNEGVENVTFKGRLAKHLKWWLVPLFALGITSIIGIGWEIHEFILDQLFTDQMNTVYQTMRQPSIMDTMGDFLNDLLGGTAAILIFHKFR